MNFLAENTSNLANYEWLYVLLKEVEFLGLRLHGNVTASSTTDFHPLLGRLLSSCKKMKSLALEPEFIHLGSGRIMSQGLETLENLEQLEILQPDDRNMIALPPRCECSGEPLRQTVPDFCDKLKNVKGYKKYFTEFRVEPQSLVSFPEMRLRRRWMEAVFLYSLCDSVVKNNCELVNIFSHIRSTISVAHVYLTLTMILQRCWPWKWTVLIWKYPLVYLNLSAV